MSICNENANEKMTEKIWDKSHYPTQKRKQNLFFLLIPLSATSQKLFFKYFFLKKVIYSI